LKPIADHNNKCPYELFTGEAPPHHLTDFRVFGCPAYVLEKNLADGNGLPKWKARAYRGVYIGHSEQHSSSVALIWNPQTKLVSAQYHVIFDEGFETVSSLNSNLDHDAIQLAFSDQLKLSKWFHQDEYAETSPNDTQHYYFDSAWDIALSNHTDAPAPTQPSAPIAPSAPSEHAHSEGAIPASQESQDPILLAQPSNDSTPYSSTYLPARLVSQLGSIIKPRPKQPRTDPQESLPHGILDPAAAHIEPSFNSVLSALFAHNVSHDNDPMAPPIILQDHIDLFALQSILETRTKVVDATSIEGLDGITNDINPLAFSAATANNPDSLTQTQMLSDRDAPEFVKAQCPEINGLQDADVFEFHHRSEIDSLPPGTHILNAIWSYHRKH